MQIPRRSQQELYQVFIEFVASDIQKERRLVNRRMLSVFFWCFGVPALASLGILILIKANVLPRSSRNHLDWLVLILPVLYSLYILGSEVLIQVPAAFRRGSVAHSLGQALTEGVWRERASTAMSQSIVASQEEWKWIISSFEMDLRIMEYRIKYLTALAGAVFFLLMQGVDSLTDSDRKVSWVKTSILGWVETSPNDLSQFVGLGLFLVLLYLSGSQTHQTLRRYLNCAQLMIRQPLETQHKH